MGKLSLASVCLNPYNPKQACAYIYYGDPDQPKDHHNEMIGNFYQSPESFATHLSKEVGPLIQLRLIRFGYATKGVDFINQAPHPFIVIVRQDGKEISEAEISHIHDALLNIIADNNKSAPFWSKQNLSIQSSSVNSEDDKCHTSFKI